MAKLLTLMVSVCLAATLASAPLQAEEKIADVEQAMKIIARNYRAISKSDDPALLTRDLQAIRSAAQQAQGMIPNKPKGMTEHSEAHKTYLTGLSKLEDQTDQALALLADSKVPEAKKVIGEMKTVRDHYHKELKVKD
ncbi:MAG: cytochrome b562 [Plesiomonas shigelloides]